MSLFSPPHRNWHAAPAWLNGVETVLLAMVISVFFFSPKFLLWSIPVENSYEVWRSQTFLRQCETPFVRDIEPAMQWRLLPPLICHWLGLRGWAALSLPWCGVVALLAYCTRILRRAGLDRWQTLLGVTLVATTSAVIVPLGWLGYNDAWVWLGLLHVAFGRARPALAVSCLLCPWVDVRFLIGVPLAVAVRGVYRQTHGPFGFRAFTTDLARVGAWLIPYGAIRIAAAALGSGDSSASFVHQQLTSFFGWAHYGPLGWWMGLRAGWWLLWPAAREAQNQHEHGALGLALLVALTCGTMLILAADISRSTAIALPVMMLGLVLMAKTDAERSTSRLQWLAGFNLLVPATHVVGTVIAVISPLPIELLRLGRRIFL